MKRIVAILILVAVALTPALAIDLSVGASFAAGLPILYGETVNDFKDADMELKGNIILNPQVDFVIGFTPFLALETGIGYLSSTWTVDGSDKDVGKSQITVPVMAKGMLQSSIGTSYLSLGLKPGFMIAEYQEGTDNESSFVLDLAVAIGHEMTFAEVHTVGLRVGYDFGLIKAYDTEVNKMNHDNLLFGLTYRFSL